jgi:hypothetical protein
VNFRGINYDTGFLSAGTTTREPFDPEVVRREMQIIRDDLHCDAVRITGGIPERLEIAASHAADAGLEVWFCPFTNNLTSEEFLALLPEFADGAERVRARGAEVVFLTGSELSLMTKGMLPGETLADRAASLADPLRLRPLIPGIRRQMNDLLRQSVDVVRARFAGKVSYASIPLDGVDWTPFDIIATDAGYRTAAMGAQFRESIRAFVAQGRALGKPVAITEFGCATHSGAGDMAARGISDVVEWDDSGRPLRLKGNAIRDEQEQARYVTELLEVFESEGVDSVFVYTFARYDLVDRGAPGEDFDVASAGLVRVLDSGRRGQRYPDLPWEPKAAFTTLAEHYGRVSSRTASPRDR